MILTISTTHRPATDLGFLLMKHPDNVHEASPARRGAGRRGLPAQARGAGAVEPGEGDAVLRRAGGDGERQARAAAAAGVSTNAVYARRLKQPLFLAKWEAVLETGRAAIEMKLVEAANRSFDPDELDTGEVAGSGFSGRPPDARSTPPVSVAESIKIVKLHGAKKPLEPLRSPFEEQAAAMGADEIEALRERLITRLKRMLERDKPGMLGSGWSYDERHDRMIPPGWVKDGG